MIMYSVFTSDLVKLRDGSHLVVSLGWCYTRQDGHYKLCWSVQSDRKRASNSRIPVTGSSSQMVPQSWQIIHSTADYIYYNQMPKLYALPDYNHMPSQCEPKNIRESSLTMKSLKSANIDHAISFETLFHIFIFWRPHPYIFPKKVSVSHSLKKVEPLVLGHSYLAPR